MTRDRRPALFLLLIAAALGGGTSCAGSARCGRNSVTNVGGTVTRAPGTGPYCVVVEAEGSGNVSLVVNGPGGGNPNGNSDTVRNPASPSGPLQYTLTPSPNGVSFVDVCNVPNAYHVLAGVDDQLERIPASDAPPIPFPIRFYDVNATAPFTVSSNGWLSFLSNAQMGPLSGQVPAAAQPNLLIAPYWTDLITRTNGVCYATIGNQPNRAFVVQWDDVGEFGGGGPNAHATFEIIIREIRSPLQHNVIDIVYERLEGMARQNPGAGIENNDGTAGTTVPQPLTAPRVFRFTPSR